jgi:transposase
MCLQAEPDLSIPEQTRQVAQAAFPKGNAYMKIRDQLGLLFTDPAFSDLFPQQGQPAEAPWRLAMVTLFQFVEELSDRQAAEAVRSRIDWKYALSLELTDPGFDSSVLCEFRTRLLANSAHARLFERMLSHLAERKLLKARGRQRTDSTHVFASVRAIGRLECLGETLRYALNSLAEAAPTWLLAQVDPDWFDRYGSRLDTYRFPADKAKREALALQYAHDGLHLLAALQSPQVAQGLADLEPIRLLRRVWLEQFYFQEGRLRLREESQMPPCALRISSPYDPQARFATKRSTQWTGYKVHLSETCDEQTPHLITQVSTTPATTPDNQALPAIWQELAQTECLPAEQLVDQGYTQASHLLLSQEQYGLALLGPLACDRSRQAQEQQGFDSTHFQIDWHNRCAVCPAGKTSQSFAPVSVLGKPLFVVTFAAVDCHGCEHEPACTRCVSRGRKLTLRPQAEQEALQQARAYQQSEAFRKRYAARAGIEGTLSQGVRAFGLRRSRYRGQAKTHLQHLMIACAINFCRVFDWLMGTPLAKTRQSRFAQLKPALSGA